MKKSQSQLVVPSLIILLILSSVLIITYHNRPGQIATTTTTKMSTTTGSTSTTTPTTTMIPQTTTTITTTTTQPTTTISTTTITTTMTTNSSSTTSTSSSTTTTTTVIYPYDMPVLDLRYFPDEDNDGKLDPDITGMNDDLTTIRSKVNTLTIELIDSLERGSTYHGYKDSLATPSLDYEIFDTKEFLYKIPLSDNLAWGKPGIYRPDYYGILSDLDICNYVDNLGVKEVWMWGYHYDDTEPDESNMAMGTDSRDYWNHGSYGDVSNSQQIDDMPTCKKTYILFNYNYGRGLGEALEDHTHQLERIFNFINISLFWNKFVNPYGPNMGITHCGWTHYPPNGRSDYDWMNEDSVESTCEDWHPDGSGEIKQVNCHTWRDHSCPDDGGTSFKIWWVQNIPGKDNDLYDGGKKLKNWWDFIGDFDQALQFGKSLKYS